VSSSEEKLSSSDLCVPIYLNATYVFDLLALGEDGFSAVTEINTTISRAKEKAGGAEVKAGANNLFALLGVSGGGHFGLY
jgi:hypothetical protein